MSYPSKFKTVQKTLWNLLNGLLTKDPEKRINAYSTLFDDWYNDDSKDYETTVHSKLGLDIDNYNVKLLKHLSPEKNHRPKNVPGYLQPTKASIKRYNLLEEKNKTKK